MRNYTTLWLLMLKKLDRLDILDWLPAFPWYSSMLVTIRHYSGILVFSPLGNDWSAKELVQLLDGLEQFGYGNWNDVSRYTD